MQPLINDATTALIRALRGELAALAPDGSIHFEEIKSRSWASVTFAGARHELALRVTGQGARAALGQFAAGLDTAEFKLRGHLLADIVLVAHNLVADGVHLRIEALTVEE